MNFQRTNTKKPLLDDYYEHFDEDGRLKTRHGNVEYVTNMKYIHELLKDMNNPKILDLGAATGAYSIPLAEEGNDVTAVELVNHNLDILKSKSNKVKCYLADAKDLSFLNDEKFDLILNFGPVYHMLNENDKIKVLQEAKKHLSDDGYMITSYYMNEYAVITYGFIKKRIMETKNLGQLDDNYHVRGIKDDLYSMDRLEDINYYNEVVGLKRYKIISSDGPSDYLRVVLNSLSDEEYEEFIKYHLSTCERQELLGASAHLIDITKKI